MTRIAVEEHDADVLNSAVGKQQLDAHGANLRLLRIFQHAFQPVRSDDLRVVVEKKQMIAVSLGGPQIHLGSQVEFVRERHSPNFPAI